MRGLSVLASTFLALVASGCAANFKASPRASFNASKLEGAVEASNAFGFDFYREVRKAQDDNLVCSPAGAAFALTMVAAGARGLTQAEILRAMHVETTDLDQTYRSFAAVLDAVKARDGNEGLVISIADRVWTQKGLTLLSDYESLLRGPFHAPIIGLDFVNEKQAALEAINQWSSDETHGRIPDLLHTVQGPLVLANAIYMLGEWRRPFAESATADDKFTTAVGESSVKMMKQLATFLFAQVRGAKLVELPYKGGLSMLVVLPDSVGGLERIEEQIGSSYSEWIQALQYREVDLKLPHFTTKTDLDLVAPLSRLGIDAAFQEGCADFSGMTGSPGLYIGGALQKAWIETSEKGTEAAAVTLIEMMNDSAVVPAEPPPRVVFHADHPFMYLIRDVKTGVILFMGHVAKPAT